MTRTQLRGTGQCTMCLQINTKDDKGAQGSTRKHNNGTTSKANSDMILKIRKETARKSKSR